MPIDRRSLLAVPVVLATGCTGGEDDEPEPVETGAHDGYITVPDQEGDGRSVRVEAMSASVEYYLELQYDSQSLTTDVYGADETASDIELELDPPVETDTTMTALLRTAADDETVIRHQLEYVFVPPDGTLEVSDQQGPGEQFVVDELSADEPYYLAVDYGAGSIETDPFEPEQSITNLVLDLDPPIRSDRTVDLSLHSIDDEWELATASVAYTFERTATLQVSDQIGDGRTLSIENASANVDFEIVASYAGTVIETDTFAAETEVAPELELDPRIVEEATVEVGVQSAEDGTRLQTEQVTYTPETPPGPELTAETAQELVEDTFPFVGTPDVFEEWIDSETAVETDPDGYQVQLGYLAVRQGAVFSSDAEATEDATAEFAIDAFEALFESEYQVLDVEVGAWLTADPGGVEQAGETRLHRDTAAGIDWDDLRGDPAESLPDVAETYEFEYVE